MKKLRFIMSIDESNIYDEVYTYTKEGKYFKFNTDEFEFSFYYDQNQIVFIKESEDNIIKIDHLNKTAELQILNPKMELDLKLINSDYAYQDNGLKYLYMLETTENIININITFLNQ